MTDHTDSVSASARPGPQHAWRLIVALDSQALTTWPESFSLGDMSEVSIGRGTERKFTASRDHARLDLPDRWISGNHARLRRKIDRWWVLDEGSRNGVQVNGERVEDRALSDGDVVACGGTFLVLRRADGSRHRGEPLSQRPEALRTLSPTLDQELDVLRKVARSPLPVLVLGESGTGKEGIANVVHLLSGREGNMLAVNCGAIPGTLIESELFGTRRGAFSGAEDRIGLVRSAEGGTLFLDEVAELPTSSQAALLRVLQQKEILPLGANRPIPVNVRVVAATNRPVAELVEEGKLRRDLYARLCGYELRMPPLRERLEDLGLLIAALVARHDGTGIPRTLSRAAAAALFAFSWPLNIRQLEQCIAGALAVSSTKIDVEHLPQAIRDGAGSAKQPAESERDRLVALLQKYQGNLSAVARELTTSRSQLYRLLTRHAIQIDPGKAPPSKTPGE